MARPRTTKSTKLRPPPEVPGKPVAKGTQDAHSSRGVRGHAPRKIFKIKPVRIALVAICASKYNYHVIELASHNNAQESPYNNKLPLLDLIHNSNLTSY